MSYKHTAFVKYLCDLIVLIIIVPTISGPYTVIGAHLILKSTFLITLSSPFMRF